MTWVIVMTSLLIFGVLYNWFVSWLERRKYDRGYTAFLVIVGTLVTLAGMAVLIGVKDALWALACFSASGLPMTLGSVCRHVKARAEDEARARELAQELLQ